jgi:hypothetical protein
LLTGTGLGFVALPPVVLFAAAARGFPDSPWIWAALAGGAVALVTGVLIGAGRIGALGLVGCVAGAIVAGAVPSVAIPRLLGSPTPDISIYTEYLPGVVAAMFLILIGLAVAVRLGLRISVRPAAVIVVGVIVLAVWFAFWFVVWPVTRSAGWSAVR